MTKPRKSTQIRNARKATAARKRAAFDFQTPNKKAPARAKGYDFPVTSGPHKAAGDKPNTPHAEVLSHEFDS